MRVLLLSLLSLTVLANSAVAADENIGWSKTINGLQARLSFARKERINGTPIVITYLELRNVSDVGNVMEIPLDPAKIKFTMIDSTGKTVEPSNGPFDGSSVELGMTRLPYDSFLRFNIASRGAGVPKDEAALLDLGPSHNWVVKRGDMSTYHLQAEFTIAQTKARHWFGTIQVPKKMIPTTQK